MHNKGSIFLIVALAVVILVIGGAAFLLMVPSGGGSPAAAGSGGSATAGSGPTFSVVLARTSTGLTATLTVANKGSDDLRDLRIIRADIASQVGGSTMPLVLGRLARGATTSLTLPYTGPAPAAKAPVQLNLQYDFKTGFFSKGGGSQSSTTLLP
jgi:hypothetical protein